MHLSGHGSGGKMAARSRKSSLLVLLLGFFIIARPVVFVTGGNSVQSHYIVHRGLKSTLDADAIVMGVAKSARELAPESNKVITSRRVFISSGIWCGIASMGLCIGLLSGKQAAIADDDDSDDAPARSVTRSAPANRNKMIDYETRKKL